MELTLSLKVIFIFVNMTVPFICGLFPIYFKACRKETMVGSIGNCFAAGIFLMIGCVHLLSESNESMTDALGYSSKASYVIALGGYMFILFVEHIVFGGSHNHHHHDDHHHESEDHHTKHVSDSHDFNSESKIPKTIEKREEEIENSHDERNIQPLVVVPGTTKNPNCENINCSPTTSQKKDPQLTDYIPAIILTSALYIHSIFEGIAMGLLTTSSETLILGIAILLHHAPAALAHSLKMEGLNRWIRLIFLFIFCSSSSTGVAIGISLSSLNSYLVQAIFLAISAGTFFYIGGTEIIPEEFADKKWRNWKFFSLTLGFLPLGVLSIYISS